MVGGDLAGSSVAVTLAREGVEVLLVERERVFRDRVRGEVMATWGTVEAKRLGLFELLLERCAIEVKDHLLCGAARRSACYPSLRPHRYISFSSPVAERDP